MSKSDSDMEHVDENKLLDVRVERVVPSQPKLTWRKLPLTGYKLDKHESQVGQRSKVFKMAAAPLNDCATMFL